jgi:hypothetical protein
MDDFPAPGALPDPLPARSRGNGLPGKHFVPLLAVDARVTSDVLAALATASIPAYARPRSATTDDVFSDAERRADARSLLALRLPEVLSRSSSIDETKDTDDTEATDATFAEIVAHWDVPVASSAPPDTAPPDTAPPAEPAPTPRAAARPADSPTENTSDVTSDVDDDHYIPPPVPPLPRLAPVTRWALIGIFAGILALVLPLMIGLNAPGWMCAMAVAAIVGGGAVMVARMGNEPRDGDDGAVV